MDFERGLICRGVEEFPHPRQHVIRKLNKEITVAALFYPYYFTKQRFSSTAAEKLHDNMERKKKCYRSGINTNRTRPESNNPESIGFLGNNTTSTSVALAQVRVGDIRASKEIPQCMERWSGRADCSFVFTAVEKEKVISGSSVEWVWL